MNGPTPDSRQLEAMFGRDERSFKLVNRPMVHLTYQTAFVDDGKLVLRDDIYGFDARIDAILHGNERRIAGAAPPQHPKRNFSAAKNNQGILRLMAGARPRPVMIAAPEFHFEAPPSPLARPFLAIFGR
jgi:hypothetical protein